ncbi:hypothetical protein HD554DRAFT_348886 [Boletus coccyginus]|nr:hypothetical protein HD554DRAFT_348886 [Boletus coccyginus]
MGREGRCRGSQWVHALTTKFFTSWGQSACLTSIQKCMEIVMKAVALAITAPTSVWKLPSPCYLSITATAPLWLLALETGSDAFVAPMTPCARSCTPWSVPRERLSDLWPTPRQPSDRGNLLLLLQVSRDGIGNVFSFLIASHDSETTAHALAATLAFLALNFGLQDELVVQVQEITQGRDGDTLLSVSLIMENSTRYLQDSTKGSECSAIRVFLVRETKHDMTSEAMNPEYCLSRRTLIPEPQSGTERRVTRRKKMSRKNAQHLGSVLARVSVANLHLRRACASSRRFARLADRTLACDEAERLG